MTTQTKGFIVGVVAMAVVVTVSNILVAHPIGNWLTWAAFTYPLAFFVTDMSNRVLGVSTARQVVFVGFILGVLLSLILADVRIAIASGTAFLSAQLLDVFIFDKLRNMQWWRAPLFSSTIASVIDTGIFFSLAFVGTGVPWVTLAIGDYGAKMLMALSLLIPFRMLYKKLVPIIQLS
jgi:uncharacterized PurR-regulated membrane protein YhhQ (DUF165 family)